MEGEGTDAGRQGHRVCRLEGEGTDERRQGHRVCGLEGEGTDAGRQGYVTGYVGWKARGPMKDDRGTSQVMSVGRRGDR